MRKLLLFLTLLFTLGLGGVAQVDAEGIPVYRFWSESKRGHFYTISEAEKDNVERRDRSWRLETIGFFAEPTSNCTGLNQVYRFWSSRYQKHFYTISEEERDYVITNNPNWQYELAAFCASKSNKSGYVPVYRFWSERYRGHFYTTSTWEKNHLITNNPNWKYEQVAFYLDDGSHYYTPSQVSQSCPAATRNCVPCTSSDHRCRIEPGNSTGFLGWSCQNNNPGNILYSSYRANIITNNGGQAPCGTRSSSTHTYMVFQSYTAGIDALKAYLRGIANGEHAAYGSCGNCSLTSFFQTYSGSSGITYANNIGSWIGVDPNTTNLTWVVDNKLDEFALAIRRQEGWFEQ
ncbi:MAG: hypothetical protein ACOCXP_02990 [Candidatus Dojkabacteria bacterium]